MSRLLTVAVVVGLCLALVSPAFAQRRSLEEETALVTQAAPSAAPAKPAKPRKVLIYTACTGFAHDTIPLAAKAMETLGKKTGAYESVISNDPANFDADKLAQFDAVILVETTGEWLQGSDIKTLSPEKQQERKAQEKERQKNLLAFISGGKGLVGIHAATDSYATSWLEFGKVIGGYFDAHPWRPVRNKVTIKVEEAGHPVVAAFEGQSFELSEEIFQFKDPYSRSKQRVLLSLDTAKSDMNVDRIRRTDGDFAVSWVKPYGEKGRVFYCSLGHIHDVFWDSKILAHYLAGIQYALGDLKVDDKPVPAATTAPATAPATQPATAPAAEAATQPTFAPVSQGPLVGGYRTLFDGKALYGFERRPNWGINRSGSLELTPGGGTLWTTDSYGDFVLDMEFSLEESDNGGVFIRTGDTGKPEQTGLEIQLSDSQYSPLTVTSCGAIRGCLAPSANAVNSFSQWNRLIITARGPSLTVELNGKKVIATNLDEWTTAGKNPDGKTNPYTKPLKDLPRAGRIGLQDEGCYGWFRNIKIKPIEPTTQPK